MSYIKKFLKVSFMVKKNISEISKQIPGSLDFRIEVASACAESGALSDKLDVPLFGS